MDIINELMSADTTEYGSHQTVDINTSCGEKKEPRVSKQNTPNKNSEFENLEYYQDLISKLPDVPCNPAEVDALTALQDEKNGTICDAICGDQEMEWSTSMQTMVKDNSECEKLKQCYQDLISILPDVPCNPAEVDALRALQNEKDETICGTICGDEEIESSKSMQIMPKDNSEQEILKQYYQELISKLPDVPCYNSTNMVNAMASEDGEEVSYTKPCRIENFILPEKDMERSPMLNIV